MAAIECRDIVFHYPRESFSLAIERLDIAAGETVAVIGPSGCGKSTLINLIAGIQKLWSGSINIGDDQVSSMTDQQVREFRLSNIGLVPQRFELLDYLTVRENVLLPFSLGRRSRVSAEISDRADQLMKSVGIYHLGDRLPDNLSQGERQRTAICRGLVARPQLILADEPTGNLDPTNQEKTVALLLEQAAVVGATVLMVTHELHFCPASSARWI
ncbi:MAG: ATP-binding cassette domain-containing protein [Verrucomicrobiota bacterium]